MEYTEFLSCGRQLTIAKMVRDFAIRYLGGKMCSLRWMDLVCSSLISYYLLCLPFWFMAHGHCTNKAWAIFFLGWNDRTEWMEWNGNGNGNGMAMDGIVHYAVGSGSSFVRLCWDLHCLNGAGEFGFCWTGETSSGMNIHYWTGDTCLLHTLQGKNELSRFKYLSRTLSGRWRWRYW